MASVHISIAFDTLESEKIKSYLVSSQHCLQLSSFSRKLRYVNVSTVATKHSEVYEYDHQGTAISLPCDTVSEGLFAKSHCFRRDIWRIGKGKIQTPQDRFTAMEKKREKRVETNLSLHGISTVDAELPYTAPRLSTEHCNDILKRLEKHGNANTLSFFEWMRNNGKLNGNATAYNLALRFLCGKNDLEAADAMIQEMSHDSACELDLQVFNTIIYGCYKQGHVNLGAKWFRMMLEYGIKPNIATFGMLMKLYQRGWNLEEAEFTFRQMRDFRIKCESAYSAMIIIYTRMNLYAKAEQIIGVLKEDEVTLNFENWLALLNAYCQQGKLEAAELAFLSMKDAGFFPNSIAYNTLITGYGKISDMYSAQCILCKLYKSGFEPDETTYRSMIEGWGRANNYGETLHYYNELKRLGFKPNSSNLYTMINLQARHGDEDGVLRTIGDMMILGCGYSSILDNILHAYERAGRMGKFPLILKGCSLYHHVLVNQTPCFVLLTMYIKHCLVDEALQIMRNKQWKDLIFEQNLYHLLICSCKDMGHFENAFKLYSHIVEYSTPNLHIMCTMIDIYTHTCLFTEAQSTFMKLKSTGIVLDVVSFSIVSRMYVKAGLLEDACTFLETMDSEIVPDAVMFRDMLRIYQKCGKLEQLRKLYYKILKSEVAWDQQMYGCVINCCARSLPVDEISRIFDEMLQLGFVPDATTVNVVIDVFGKSRLLKKARNVFWMARKQGLADVISYNTLIAAYGRSKQFRLMSSTIQIMEFSGFSVSTEAFNCMLDAYGKDGQLEKFRDVLQRMKDSKCDSDPYTYNIKINLYGEHAWIIEVLEVLREFKESGLGPNLCSYNTLIKAYGIAGMVDDALSVLKEMRENNIEPDRITYMNLISSLTKNDMHFEAVKWSLLMKQMKL